MRYDPIHNTILHDAADKRYEVDDEDAVDENGILKDGRKIRVPLSMRDSNPHPCGAKMWYGPPMPLFDSDIRSKPRTTNDKVALVDRQKIQDWQKAELSARWKGGLADGDIVRLGDRMQVVAGRNPENGKVQLRDATTTHAETVKQAAYVAYDAAIQNAWRTRDAESDDACTIDGELGRWRKDKDGNLVCTPTKTCEPSDHEWMAGPLSDAERIKAKDAMYSEYEAELVSRWRR